MPIAKSCILHGPIHGNIYSNNKYLRSRIFLHSCKMQLSLPHLLCILQFATTLKSAMNVRSLYGSKKRLALPSPNELVDSLSTRSFTSADIFISPLRDESHGDSEHSDIETAATATVLSTI